LKSILNFKLLFIVAFWQLLFYSNNLYSDIVTTKNNMVINGDIISDSETEIVIRRGKGTEAQIIRVKKDMIKEIKRTPQVIKNDPVKPSAAPTPVKENQTKTQSIPNKETEPEKKPLNIKTISETSPVPIDPVLPVNVDTNTDANKQPLYIYGMPFIAKNFGTLGEYLPTSIGVALNIDYPITNHFSFRNIFIPDYIRGETGYQFSKKGNNRLDVIFIEVGPMYIYRTNHAIFFISPVAGAALCSIKFVNNSSFSVKSKLSVAVGSHISSDRLIITPAIRFDIIYDKQNSLWGYNGSIGAGFLL
jgi:hypothetical protein